MNPFIDGFRSFTGGILPVFGKMRAQGGGLFGGLFSGHEEEEQPQQSEDSGNLSDIITRELIKSRSNKDSREKWNDVIGRFRS